MSDLQQQIDALSARVAQLEAERWTGPPRLGPQPITSEQREEQIQQMVKVVALSVVEDQVVIDIDSAHLVTKEEAERIAKLPPVDRTALCTTNGKTPEEVRANQKNETGQHAGYIVLCEDERAKGFVRPYRNSYKHVGLQICGRHVGPDGATVCYMDLNHSSSCGVAKGPRRHVCGRVTTMSRDLSETYARDPGFYGATFCCHCNAHFPVAEFVWTTDGQQVGS